MTNGTKTIPWLLSAGLAILLVVTWQDSQKTIAQKDVEIAALKQQHTLLVTDANSKLADANTKLYQLTDEASSKLADANTKLHQLTDEANNRIQLANQPEIPVRMTFRKALMGSGNVAGFGNMSGQTIAITANVERRSSGQNRSFYLTIDSGKTKEVGEREGWAFIAGDTITVSQPEHKSLSFRAP